MAPTALGCPNDPGFNASLATHPVAAIVIEVN
jgi:hypothetical protein